MKNEDIELIPVEGHNALGRDPNSNAIVNTDSTGYDAYIRARDKAKEKDQELTELKAELDEIKSLLKSLVQERDK
jgi:hypothetical protein